MKTQNLDILSVVRLQRFHQPVQSMINACFARICSHLMPGGCINGTRVSDGPAYSITHSLAYTPSPCVLFYRFYFVLRETVSSLLSDLRNHPLGIPLHRLKPEQAQVWGDLGASTEGGSCSNIQRRRLLDSTEVATQGNKTLVFRIKPGQEKERIHRFVSRELCPEKFTSNHNCTWANLLNPSFVTIGRNKQDITLL